MFITSKIFIYLLTGGLLKNDARLGQERIQLTAVFQGEQIITAANMGIAHPDLRHGMTTTSFNHLLAQPRVSANINFAILDRLAI
jgi:hypothetical protein